MQSICALEEAGSRDEARDTLVIAAYDVTEAEQSMEQVACGHAVKQATFAYSA